MLAAIAEGNNTKEGIASYIGRESGDLANLLNVLQDCGGTRHEPCSCSPGGARGSGTGERSSFGHIESDAGGTGAVPPRGYGDQPADPGGSAGWMRGAEPAGQPGVR